MPGQPFEAARARALEAARQGDLASAARHMAQACQLAPQRGELHFQLACLLAHGRRFEASLEPFDRATEQLPGFAEAWWFKGRALARLGRHADSIQALRQARRLAPDDARLEQELAEAEFLQGWPADALPLWEAALARQPDDVHARLRVGETLSRLGFQSRAVALYRDGVQRLPGTPALWLALAQAEEDDGEQSAAQAAYAQALALRPAWPFAVAGLVGMLRGRAPEALVEQAARLLEDPSLPDGDRALVGYALGKVHDARGEHDAAMARWHAANAARRRVAGDPDPVAWTRRIDRIMDAFPRGKPRPGPPGAAGAGDRLVFVVGMPRSGTTLTEQILASHPLVHGCGELPDLAMIARRIGGDGSGPDALDLPPDADLRAHALRYEAAATRHAPPGAARLVDKEPLNFLHLGLVAAMFPEARVIWCRRDPRDIAVSIYGENFALDETLATDLGGIGHYIRGQERLMRHWQSVLPLRIIESRYEDLVAAPEAQSRRLIAFLDLAWDPACLDFHRSERAVQSPSRWQVRQPIHARSIGRWHDYATHLAPLLDVVDTADVPAVTER